MARPLTITPFGNVQVSTARAKSGGASILFDGNEDYLVVDNTNGDLNVTGAWTVETWHYFGAFSGTVRHVFSNLSSGGFPSKIWYLEIECNNSSGRLIFGSLNVGPGLVNISLAKTGNVGWIANDWNHIAVSSEGNGSANLYLNGTRVARQTGAGYYDLISTIDGVNQDVYIGKDINGSFTNELNGSLDEIRISNVCRYTGTTFTPASRFTPDDNTVLLIHGDGTNGSTTFTDDTGIRGTANLSATATQTATANPNPSMVFIRDDYQYDWNEPNSWDDWGIFDSWFQGYRFPTVVATQTAIGTKAQFGSASLSAAFTQSATATRLLSTANAVLATTVSATATGRIVKNASAALTVTVSQTATAIRYAGGSAALAVAVTQSATARVTVNASASMSAAFTQTVSARILKLAQLDIPNFATLTASARVEHNASAALSAAFTQSARGGRLVQVNETFNYTWDTLDPDTWQGFVRDEWGPTGFFAFDNVALSARGGLSIVGSASLSSEFALVARGGELNLGTANLTATVTLSASARIERNAQSQLQAQFTQSAAAVNLKIATANLSVTANVIATSGVTRRASANFQALATELIVAQNFKRASAALSAAFAVQATASLTPAILPFALPVSTNLNVSARMVLAGRADLSAFATDLSVGRRFLGGRANLNSEFAVVARPSIRLGGRADLSALAAQLTVGRISTVRGTASLSAEFAGVFAGELQLLESNFIFKILPETRNYFVETETRNFKVLPENTQWSVTSEDRNIKVLPESRDLNIADLMMG
jgi:hypothetical protein